MAGPAVTGPAVREADPRVPGAALLAVPPPRFTGMLPLWYQLAQSLRATILGLDREGSLRLPTEMQLARHYGVSLTTVRQALSSLAAEGLTVLVSDINEAEANRTAARFRDAGLSAKAAPKSTKTLEFSA